MKVYRGPISKEDYDHDLVDGQDLSSDLKPWTKEKSIRFNITKEAFAERQAIARIVFTEDDILALYAGLIAGREAELKLFKEKEELLRAALKDIQKKASLYHLTREENFSEFIGDIAYAALRN